MKKIFIVFLLAGCASFLSAQTQSQTETSELQTELRKLHSTLKALQRSQASQKKTFNILENRVDSLQTALHVTQVQARQMNDSLLGLSKVQTEHAARMESIETSLDTRTALIILALVAIAGLSLVIFFTLKKAIGEASEIIMKQTLKPAQAATALIVDTPQKKSTFTLPIEPELFAPAETQKAETGAAAGRVKQPELHIAIAEMIAAPEHAPAASRAADVPPKSAAVSGRTGHTKASGQCQGVTKTGARCKRKALAGTHFCSQHSK